jgi:hypothetical protein
VPCVELLTGLHERCSVVLSVPNDAFWAAENPMHLTIWGEGAFDELRRLVPAEHTVLEQVPIAGSAIAPTHDLQLALEDAAVPSGRVPSSYLLAFGARVDRLAPVAATRVVDADAQRRHERERDGELAILAARVAELEKPD